MLVLYSLALLLAPAAWACDMCKMGMTIDHTQGTNGQQMNMNMGAQEQIQQLQQSNKMLEQMLILMMKQKQEGWGGHQQGGSEQRCPGFADVVFVLDSSGSIGQENFDKQLKFVGNVAGRFQLSQGGRPGYQVSVVSFSNSVREEFVLNQFENSTAMKEAISKISYMAGGTSTDQALEYVSEESFLARRGSRGAAIKIVIVMTDGRSENAAKTKAMAREIHNKGIMVIAIGVGDNLDEGELKDIASGNNNIFRAASFDVLDNIKQAVETRACTITIEQGGAIMDGASNADKQAYREMVEEQKRLEKERQYQQQMLDSFKNFMDKDKVEHEVKEHEMEEKDKLEYMEAKIKMMMEDCEHFDKLAKAKTEMAHDYMYAVTAQMIRFCPLSSENTMAVMKFMAHGDSNWSPGEVDECNVEDMPEMDQKQDPMVIAQHLADKSPKEQIGAFFTGMKDSVCGALVVYLRQLEEWERQYPAFSNMM